MAKKKTAVVEAQEYTVNIDATGADVIATVLMTPKQLTAGEYTLTQTISAIVGNRVIWGDADKKVQLTEQEAKALKNYIK